jgi:hypothetical protein
MKVTAAFLITIFPVLFSGVITGFPKAGDFYYWGARYNDSLLFDSNNDSKKDWTLSVRIGSINKNDSIQLFLQPDYSLELNPMIIIKDSLSKNMIRCFPGTDKVAVKDILRYISKDNNRVWILYTHKEAGKDQTVIWDMENTYPRRGGYPRLSLTIVE